VDENGGLRTVDLSEVMAGMDVPAESEPTDLAKIHQNIPALAIDSDSRRAFVIPATGGVAEVSLTTLAVSYHSLVQPISLLGCLHDFVEPQAEAKGVKGPVRTARWLGSGVVAVTGGDETATLDASNQLHASWSPAGLTLVDTNTWGTKVIDRGADSFTVLGDTLLVTGSRWDDSDRSGMGLAAYGLDGTRRASVLGGNAAQLVLAFRGRAYLDLGQRYTTKVVDLASGRLLKDRHAPLAKLLLGISSN
jgi:hypothetical protein